MEKARLYLDLDRTLFMTDEAVIRLREACGVVYGLDAKQIEQDAGPFFHLRANQRYYEFFEQLDSCYGISIDDARQKLAAAVAADDFLYPDARELLRYLKMHSIIPTVLSFGNADFQTFKFSLVPELHEFEIICTLEPKGEYFKAHSDERSILVDDKYVEDLPLTCQGVLIDRRQIIPLQQKEGYLTINNLAVVEKLVP